MRISLIIGELNVEDYDSDKNDEEDDFEKVDNELNRFVFSEEREKLQRYKTIKRQSAMIAKLTTQLRRQMFELFIQNTQLRKQEKINHIQTSIADNIMKNVEFFRVQTFLERH